MSSNKVQPIHCKSRSIVYRKFDSLPVTWTEFNGYASAHSIRDPDPERSYAQQMTLCDLSYVQRVGFKGAGTNE